jgi:hypothetical protein
LRKEPECLVDRFLGHDLLRRLLLVELADEELADLGLRTHLELRRALERESGRLLDLGNRLANLVGVRAGVAAVPFRWRPIAAGERGCQKKRDH